METFDVGEDSPDVDPTEDNPEAEAESGEEEEEERPPVHYSTGRLTRAQAAAVDRWRARLREDKPLPGEERVSAAARMLGSSDHPRASTSDAIAAATYHLLSRQPPEPLEIAVYAYRAIREQWLAGQGRGDPGRAPVRPPVSYYLPAELADEAEKLTDAAPLAARERYHEIAEEAVERWPGEGDDAQRQRGAYVAAQVEHEGLYYLGLKKDTRLRSVPYGVIGRLAIDHWARRPVDEVIAAAVDWCQFHHEQWHRARHDMHKLTR
jgi:hypothetical protein